MMRSNNNGAWLALGLVGLAAGAAALQQRSGSRSSHPTGSCSCCGISVSGSLDKGDDDDGDAEGESAEARGTFLLRNRFDAVNAFALAAEDAVELRDKRDAFLEVYEPYLDSLSQEQRFAEAERQGEVLRWVFQISKLVDQGGEPPRLTGQVSPQIYVAAKSDSKATRIAKALTEDPNKVFPKDTLGAPQIEELRAFTRRHSKQQIKASKELAAQKRLLRDAIALAYQDYYLNLLLTGRAWSLAILDGYVNLNRFAVQGGRNQAGQSFGFPDYLDEDEVGLERLAPKAAYESVRSAYEAERKRDQALMQAGNPGLLLLRTPEVAGRLPLALGRDRRLPVYAKGGGRTLFTDMKIKIYTDVKVSSSTLSFGEGQEALRAAFDVEADKAADRSLLGGVYPIIEKAHRNRANKEEEKKAEDADVINNELNDGESVPQVFMYAPVSKNGRREESRVALFFVAENGTMYFDYGTLRVPLLTKTSKMSSPSFGLPAGLATEGGTCPARSFGQKMVRAKQKTAMVVEQDLRALEQIQAQLGAGPIKRGGALTQAQAQRLARVERLISQMPVKQGKRAPSAYSKSGIAALIRHLRAKVASLKEEYETFKAKLICDRCYAMGANYGYANNMIAQEARRRWIIGLASEAGSKEQTSLKLAANLALMVASYAKDGRHPDRNIQEIGVWKGGEITYAASGGRAPCLPTTLRLQMSAAILRPEQREALDLGGVASNSMPQLQSELLNLDNKPVTDTLAYFKRAGVTDNKVCGFFRIHDSGDFGVADQTFSYIQGWSMAASVLPYVQFWAPTRTWATMVPRSRLSDPLEKQRDALMMNEIGPTLEHPEARMPIPAKQRLVQAQLPQAERIDVTPVVPGAPLKTYRLLNKQQGSAAIRGLQGITPVAQLRVADPSADPLAKAPGESGVQNIELDQAGGKVVSLFKSYLKPLRALSRNANFALRPSTLYVTKARMVGGKALSTGQSSNIPFINDLSAGSGVVEKADGKAYPEVYDMRGIQAYACPVYTKDESGKEAKSCRDAHCRACWLAQNLPVFYGAH